MSEKTKVKCLISLHEVQYDVSKNVSLTFMLVFKPLKKEYIFSSVESIKYNKPGYSDLSVHLSSNTDKYVFQFSDYNTSLQIIHSGETVTYSLYLSEGECLVRMFETIMTLHSRYVEHYTNCVFKGGLKYDIIPFMKGVLSGRK